MRTGMVEPRATGAATRDDWIPRRSELFRHLRPPDSDAWQPDADTASNAGQERAAWLLESLAADGSTHARLRVDTDAASVAAALAAVPSGLLAEYAPLARAHARACAGVASLVVEGTGAGEMVRIRRVARGRVDASLLVIDVAAGASLTLVEQLDEDAGTPLAPGDASRNLVSHVRLGAGARLRHLRIGRAKPQRHVAHRTVVTVAAGARYDGATIADGGSYHLQRSEIDLVGSEASATAVAVLLSTASRIEQQVVLRHTEPATRSRTDILALAARDARVVANAMTAIPPEVTGASTSQRLHGVPTDGHPRIVLRPHLEILHDQVEARHGATWGPLPEEALFYAAQRGLDPIAARSLIVDGMAHALIASCIDDDALLGQSGLTGALADAIADHLNPPSDRRDD